VIVRGAVPPEAVALPRATVVSMPDAWVLRSEGALIASEPGLSVPAGLSIDLELPP